MRAKAVNRSYFLSYVEPLGKNMPHNVVVTLPDSVMTNASFAALVESGEIEIIAYGDGATDVVTQEEVKSYLSGLFKATVAAAGTGITSTSPMVKAILESVTVTTFDLKENNVLMLKVDGLYPIKLVTSKAVYDTAGLVALINAQTVAEEGYYPASKHVVASASTGKIKLTGKSFGLNSKIEALSGHSLDANQIILFPSISDPVETAQAEKLTFTFKGPTGNLVSGAKVKLTSWDADVAGNQLTTSTFQRVTKGTWEGDLHDNEIVLVSNDEGKAEVEVIDSGAVNVFIETALASADYIFAAVPAARSEITVTQV